MVDQQNISFFDFGNFVNKNIIKINIWIIILNFFLLYNNYDLLINWEILRSFWFY